MVAVLMIPGLARSQTQNQSQGQDGGQQPDTSLTSMSIEQLMQVDVTSVSKRSEPLDDLAAAIFVITQDDIRRSGATNIPDLLRMVPGVDVAQITANSWAISVRGLNARYGNKLLVMVDGRSVYTPTFGGVFWDVLDVPLENIDRIEVVRGPGGVAWGDNAVNGVINIITKKTEKTLGGLVVAGGGNLDQGFGTVQYGGKFGKATDYRVYMKYLNQAQLPNLSGQPGGDGWHTLRSGFRVDSTLSSKDTLSVEGQIYAGQQGNPVLYAPSANSPEAQPEDMQVGLSGGDLQGTWNHTYSARSDTRLQVSYDHYKRNDVLREGRSTLTIDFQHHYAWKARQNIVWGAEYSYSDSHTDGSFGVFLDPANLNTQLFNVFIQDEIALIANRLTLTLGTRVENNYYTGFGNLPSARLSWKASSRQMFWASVSKAERIPASTDTALRVIVGGFTTPNGPPALITLFGNPNFQNENLIAYEAGYRTTIGNHVSVDIAAYYNDYDHEQTTESGLPFFEVVPPPHLVIPLTYGNLSHGETEGVEFTGNWRVTNRWTLSPGYAYEVIHFRTKAGSNDTTSVPTEEGSTPTHSAQLRSHIDLLHSLSWDTSAYFVDRLDYQAVPAYTRLDTQLMWQCSRQIVFSLVGQNLLQSRHIEWNLANGGVISTMIKRSAYAKITWRFGEGR